MVELQKNTPVVNVNWRQNLAFIWASQFLAMIGFGCCMPFIPLMLRQNLHIEDEHLRGLYMSIYYLASINAWVLDGKGSVQDFPHSRGDFHEYMAANPRAFAKDVDFAVQALTGKTAKELVTEKEKGENSPTSEAPKGKKKAFAWIGRLLRRSS